MMKNNEMMKKMENGETVIGMLCHVIIGVGAASALCYEHLILWTPIKFFPIAAGRMTTLYPIPTLYPYLYYS